jgi:hypothetical protein
MYLSKRVPKVHVEAQMQNFAQLFLPYLKNSKFLIIRKNYWTLIP